MEVMINELSTVLGAQIPTLIGAIAILIVGWIAAQVVASMGRGLIHTTTLDVRMAGWIFPGEPAKSHDIQKWTGNFLFAIVMLLVVMGVLQTLQLTQVNEPFNVLLSQVFEFLPRLMSAALLLGAAWILATILRLGVVKGLAMMRFDERFRDQTEVPVVGEYVLSKGIGETVYWLVFLLFLPAILGALAVEGLLDPVKGLTETLLQFLPNLFAAGLILAIGWFIARMVQRIVSNVLAAVGSDQFGDRVGLNQVLGDQRLSKMVGLLVYVLILVPVLVGALNALELDAITTPASNMLGTMFGVIPDLVGAALMLLVAYIIGQVVASLVSNLLTGIGFNTILIRLGVAKEQAPAANTPAMTVGTLIVVAIMLFASVEAAEVLGFNQLADLISSFIVFAGQLLLGVVIFGIGLYFSNLAATTVRSSGAAQASLLALAARSSILVLAAAMALGQMGLADDIVNLAFGLTLGAIAVAAALAVGLGGREIVAHELKEWVQSLKKKDSKA